MTSPVTVQSDFRLRNDDGSEKTATWVAAQNANANAYADRNYRIRHNIRETNNRAFTLDAQLEYNLAGAGWNAVNASSSVVRSSASANFADGDATTEQLAGAGTFVAGKMEEVDGRAEAVSIQLKDTEIEHCFQIRGADVSHLQTLQLRITDAGTALTTYSNTITITIHESLGAMSATGAGVATATGAARSDSEFYSAGAAVATGSGAAISSADINGIATGQATVEGIGVTIASGDLNAAGLGTASAVGQEVVAGSVESGDISATGASVASVAGAAIISAECSAAGAATAILVGEAVGAPAEEAAPAQSPEPSSGVVGRNPWLKKKKMKKDMKKQQEDPEIIVLDDVDDEEEIARMVAAIVPLLEQGSIGAFYDQSIH